MKQDRKEGLHKLNLQLAYPLDERHLLINKPKRSFRAMSPKSAHIVLDNESQKEDCDQLTFSFQVRNSYIKYILEDASDQCVPFTVEGKWHLNFSKKEELEELLESELERDLEHMTKTEILDMKTDNDMLIDDLQSE